MGRLRVSHPTSTLIPDLDNANVGKQIDYLINLLNAVPSLADQS